MEKHIHILELPKILERLAGMTACAEAADAARSIRPARELIEARRLQDETWEAYTRLAKFAAPSFGGLAGVSDTVRRAEAGGVLTMGELLAVAGVLRVVRGLDEWGKNAERDKMSALMPFFELLSPNKYLEELISGAILSEDAMSDKASPELYDIRRKMRGCAQRAREHLERLIRSASYQKYLQDAIITLRDDRFVVPVKAEHKADVPGLVHDTSASGATLFIEPMPVVETNNEIKLLAAKEQEEIRRILAELSAQVGQFAEPVARSAQAAVELNVIFAKARLGYEMKAAAPILNDRGEINLKKARHPLLDPAKVVAIDLSLGEDYTALVITGPNTGGKTVTLKTIGLLTLMAMCGLMIPAADESKISVFEHVLADIGDEQSIEQSLSTFSSHMTNIVSIFETAGQGSLILMDELGAGTDPVEGAALAISILEELRQRGAVIAATTHYAELKAYALDTPGVKNAGCEFDIETLRPTYRILTGIPGRSNAFAISGRLGVPGCVLERAQSLVSGENRRFEAVVRSLEDARASLEREQEKARGLKEQLEEAEKRYSCGAARLEKEQAAALDQAKAQASSLIEKAKSEAARLLGEIEAYKKEMNQENAADMARRAKAAFKTGVERMSDAADPVENKSGGPAYALPRPLQKGDAVLVQDLGQRAEVLEAPEGAGPVLVQLGMIKTRVPAENLRLLEQNRSQARKNPPTRANPGLESRAQREVMTELDLRGKNADEAILELDAFLDRAVLSGMLSARIIHGKGTGVLRAAVQKHLRGHPHIAASRLGVFGEGGDGVTVAELK